MSPAARPLRETRPGTCGAAQGGQPCRNPGPTAAPAPRGVIWVPSKEITTWWRKTGCSQDLREGLGESAKKAAGPRKKNVERQGKEGQGSDLCSVPLGRAVDLECRKIPFLYSVLLLEDMGPPAQRGAAGRAAEPRHRHRQAARAGRTTPGCQDGSRGEKGTCEREERELSRDWRRIKQLTV